MGDERNRNTKFLLTYRTLCFLQVWEKQGNDFVHHWKTLPELSPNTETTITQLTLQVHGTDLRTEQKYVWPPTV